MIGLSIQKLGFIITRRGQITHFIRVNRIQKNQEKRPIDSSFVKFTYEENKAKGDYFSVNNIEYIFDSENRLLEAIDNRADGPSFVNTYNQKGRIISSSKFTNSGYRDFEILYQKYIYPIDDSPWEKRIVHELRIKFEKKLTYNQLRNKLTNLPKDFDENKVIITEKRNVEMLVGSQ